MSPVNELHFFQGNSLIIAIRSKIMLFGPGSSGEKNSRRLLLLSIFSHGVGLIFFSSGASN